MLPAVLVAVVALLVGGGWPASAAPPAFTPGAPGIGDPYYPLAGNGGYDALHYGLDVRYDPATDVLTGVAAITARATQDLSRFDLDLVGLTVRSVAVDGRAAAWTRSGQELVVTPERGLRRGRHFRVDVRYDGVPQPVGSGLGAAGFLHTDDGALVAGQPEVAATWFPVNDHPADKASYTIRATVPAGLQAISNGVLAARRTAAGWTSWTWVQKEPMASYLATATIGRFDVKTYRDGRLQFIDAVDPRLDVPFVTAPYDGERFLYSGAGADGASYRRLTRTIAVPAGGGDLTFRVARETEESWDHVIVEARPAGTDDWTTLQDRNGHTSRSTGSSCPYWLDLHPFLTHYQTAPASEEDPCAPTGTTGEWWSATGAGEGWEAWAVDLAPYAGRSVEVAISYVSDDIFQEGGVAIDAVAVPGGAGSTSFEDDGDPLDGWAVSGPPPGSPPNPDDWRPATAGDVRTLADDARASLERGPEVIRFLSERFGRYPFRTAGGIVDAYPDLGFALENQTRPIYSQVFFENGPDVSVVVHELAHQWFGDDVALRRWQDIWLNEGFATYAEWLWSEDQGQATADDIFYSYASAPADDPFWDLAIGDPGPERLFDFAVYARGAMTLHELRRTVGDDDFFRILRTWARVKSGGNGTTPEFVALAERISGQQLDAFFDAWLFTAERPGIPLPAAALAATSTAAAQDLRRAPQPVRDLAIRTGRLR